MSNNTILSDPEEKIVVNGQDVPKDEKYNDSVNHPSHYMGNGIESIEVIEGFDLNYHLGNSVKYILRAGKKDDKKQDLEKAIWYLKREIERC